MERVSELRERVLSKPVGYTLLWLGTPMMIVQLVNISYSVADSIWLSKYSRFALAVPRQVWPVFMFINAITQGLTGANHALISQYIGAKMFDEAKRVFKNLLTTALALNAVAVTFFLISRSWIFNDLVKTPVEIIDDVLVYSAIISIDLFLAGFTFGYSTLFQSIGDTRTPSRIAVVSSLMNIVLDPFFIFGLRFGSTILLPEMGVAGAAVATVISRFTGLLLLMLVLKRRYPVFKPSLTRRIDRDWVARSIEIGGPITLMFMANSLAFMFQNRLVNSFGAPAAAAFSIGFILSEIADAALWGFLFAVSTMIGQALGAEDYARAREVAWKSTLYIGLASTIGSIIVVSFRNHLISFFTMDHETFRYADEFIKLFGLTIPFFAVFFIGMSIGRGSGHTRIPTVLGVVRLWVLRIGFGYLLGFKLSFGLTGVWFAMAFSNVAIGLAIIPWILKGGWVRTVINKGRPIAFIRS